MLQLLRRPFPLLSSLSARRFGTSSSSAHDGTAPAVINFRPVLKPLFLAVHPDLFEAQPLVRETNMESLARLNGIVDYIEGIRWASVTKERGREGEEG
jgi:hypothetical protein